MSSRRSFLRLASAATGAAFLPSCVSPGGGGISLPGTSGPFALGIDNLAQSGFAAVRGKRVGLILNQTSASGNGTPSRVVLQRALGRNFTSLYTPEHGLDGREKAGIHVTSRRDPITGLPLDAKGQATFKPTAFIEDPTGEPIMLDWNGSVQRMIAN